MDFCCTDVSEFVNDISRTPPFVDTVNAALAAEPEGKSDHATTADSRIADA